MTEPIAVVPEPVAFCDFRCAAKFGWLDLVVELWPVSLYDEEFVMPRCHRRLLYFERVIAMGAMPV
jgi:hypothetical protein